MSQTHEMFEVFTGTLVDGGLGEVAQDVERFVADNRDIVAISLGTEIIGDQALVSLGFRDLGKDEEFKNVKLTTVKLASNLTSGELDSGDIADALENACIDVPNVVCHDFFYHNGTLSFVLLSLV